MLHILLLNAMIHTSTAYQKENKGRDRRKGTGGNKLMFLLFFDFFSSNLQESCVLLH